MAKRQLPSPDYLRQLLRYDPESGKFFWRERTPKMFKACSRSAEHKCNLFNNSFAGKEAFTSDNGDGYLQTSIENTPGFRAHRVAFAIMTGHWPDGEIDHINGNRSDNRWENLREVSASENGKNKRKSLNSRLPHMGVRQNSSGTWNARIKSDKKEIYLGAFKTKEDAIAARKSAEERYGFHRNHGNP